MLKRSEEDIIAKSPFKVTLGTNSYDIKPLGITPQREWRNKLTQALFPVLDSFQAKTLQDALRGGLAAALIQFPEKLTELVFAYAPDLPKDQLMQEATEEQIATAFSAIMTVAYPFLPQLTTVTQLWRTSKMSQ